MTTDFQATERTVETLNRICAVIEEENQLLDHSDFDMLAEVTRAKMAAAAELGECLRAAEKLRSAGDAITPDMASRLAATRERLSRAMEANLAGLQRAQKNTDRVIKLVMNSARRVADGNQTSYAGRMGAGAGRSPYREHGARVAMSVNRAL